jgi:hypothetical protein
MCAGSLGNLKGEKRKVLQGSQHPSAASASNNQACDGAMGSSWRLEFRSSHVTSSSLAYLHLGVDSFFIVNHKQPTQDSI